MENNQTNIQRLIDRFLTEKGWEILCKSGLCAKLLRSFHETDLDQIETKNVYFNPIFSPAANSIIQKSVEVKSNIITVDLNLFASISIEEGVAIILHELGHIFNPAKGDQGEFNADAFAVNRGFREFNIFALNRFKQLFPERFDKPFTDKRIEKMNEIQI